MTEDPSLPTPLDTQQTPRKDESVRIDRRLLEILVCPLTKSVLRYDASTQELISPSALLAYPIRDGIPILLPDEAREMER